MHLNKIHHIAIICSDYNQSKYFYTEVLGLTVIRESYREERQSYKLDLSLNGEYIIELFSFPNPPKRISRPELLKVFSNPSISRAVEMRFLESPSTMEAMGGTGFTVTAGAETSGATVIETSCGSDSPKAFRATI